MNRISNYQFGKISIDGKSYTSDVVIGPKDIYSPWFRLEGHNVQIDDLGPILKMDPEILIIGTGQAGVMKVQEAVKSFLHNKNIDVLIVKTTKAVEMFNKAPKDKVVVAALHLTC